MPFPPGTAEDYLPLAIKIIARFLIEVLVFQAAGSAAGKGCSLRDFVAGISSRKLGSPLIEFRQKAV